MLQPAYSTALTPTHTPALPLSNPFEPSIENTKNLPDKIHSISSPDPSPSTLKGHVWSYKRIAPTLLVLIACITGVTCSLMWNFYLLIPFGPGFLASLYLLHLGCYDQELITLSENNAVLERNNAVLKKEIVNLKVEIDRFTEQNHKLKQTLRDYVSLYNKFSLSVEDLARLETGLATTAAQAGQQNQTLQGIITGLEGLSQNFQSFDSGFRGHLDQQEKQFTTLVKHLEAFAKVLSDPVLKQSYQQHTVLIAEHERILAQYEHLVPLVKKLEKTANDLENKIEQFQKEIDRLSQEISRLGKLPTPT